MKIKITKQTLTAVSLFVATAILAGPGKNEPKAIKYIDKSNMDLSVKPGDNFYLFVNGNWIKNNPVPASKTRWGSFDVLREESSKRLRTLLEESAKNTGKDRKTQMIGDFYASGMDSVAIQSAGITGIKADLDRIAEVKNIQSALTEVATLRTLGYGAPLFRMGVGQDRKNVDQYIPQLSQGGTTLPDRDYYIKNDPRSIRIRDAYKTYLQQLFTLAGED
ncbi:MAG: M13 family peptidase, partial [Segetibacter sp.]